MNFRIRINLGNADFNVTTETLDELLEQYGKINGDPRWLLKRVQEQVGLIESGQMPVPVTTGTPWLETMDPQGDQSSPAGGDAWAQDGPWSASGSTETPAKVDPWTRTPVSDNRPAQTRSAPQRPAPQASPAGANSDVDKYGRTWIRGLPDAPLCNCGLPTVRLDAVSGPTSKRPGTPYSKFRCDNRDNNCGYDEFPPR
jgi:hypothetical protein